MSSGKSHKPDRAALKAALNILQGYAVLLIDLGNCNRDVAVEGLRAIGHALEDCHTELATELYAIVEGGPCA